MFPAFVDTVSSLGSPREAAHSNVHQLTAARCGLSDLLTWRLIDYQPLQARRIYRYGHPEMKA